MGTRNRNVFVRVVAIGLAAAGLATGNAQPQLPPDSPQFRERCKQWIERKGYPVDYMEQKTGKRQPGFAASWKGNVKPEEVQVGDVVIRSGTTDEGRAFQIAGYVEEVEPAVGGSGIFLTVSAMGMGGRQWVDKECWVTETFGQVSRTRIPLTAVVRVWRPSLPLE